MKDEKFSRRDRKLLEERGICPDCGGLISIRNPTGKRDHLYYPENVNKKIIIEKGILIENFEQMIHYLRISGFIVERCKGGVLVKWKK